MATTCLQKEKNKLYYEKNKSYFKSYRLAHRNTSRAYSKVYYLSKKLEKQELQKQELEKRSVILRNASVSKEHLECSHSSSNSCSDPTEDNSSVGSGSV